jgi:hypothetical protein
MRHDLGPYAIAAAMLLLGCGEQRGSIELRTATETIARCETAAITELSPSPGGWAFKCNDGSSVYVIYETNDTPAKGTIEAIDVNRGTGERLSLLPAYRASEVDDAECPSASALGAKVGGEPLLAGLRGLATGTRAVEMARPCGTLEIVVGIE